jgi:hypothetical protein
MGRPSARIRPYLDETEDADDADDVEDRLRNDVFDPTEPAVRVCADLCSTCVFRPGNLMHLRPGRLADLVAQAQAREGHIVCHSTLGTSQPAICRGYADGPDRGRSLTLRLGRALGIVREITPPSFHQQDTGSTDQA